MQIYCFKPKQFYSQFAHFCSPIRINRISVEFNRRIVNKLHNNATHGFLFLFVRLNVSISRRNSMHLNEQLKEPILSQGVLILARYCCNKMLWGFVYTNKYVALLSNVNDKWFCKCCANKREVWADTSVGSCIFHAIQINIYWTHFEFTEKMSCTCAVCISCISSKIHVKRFQNYHTERE